MKPTSEVRPGRRRRGAWLLLLSLASSCAFAGGGPLGIDHELPLDQSGIWARNYQTALEFGVVAVEAAGSLWYGNDNKIGHTFWQSADASIISGLGSLAMKYSFSRARPYQSGGNPNRWFQGSCCQSFPSGEVTLQASFVTPFIVNYAKQHPWVWSLEALPVYDAFARMKARAHWQSDVLVGWALGTAVGYWSTTRKVPITVEVLPRGLSVGFYKKF
ncbi:MAG TPA: phosphatase PAP2 family protein [Steroidobacteraceae bacterium]|nr:phosphatase PAP2 family protein [Steroidobacteraceae bacterium]